MRLSARSVTVTHGSGLATDTRQPGRHRDAEGACAAERPKRCLRGLEGCRARRADTRHQYDPGIPSMRRRRRPALDTNVRIAVTRTSTYGLTQFSIFRPSMRLK
jgi:hypothetical protein